MIWSCIKCYPLITKLSFQFTKNLICKPSYMQYINANLNLMMCVCMNLILRPSHLNLNQNFLLIFKKKIKDKLIILFVNGRDCSFNFPMMYFWVVELIIVLGCPNIKLLWFIKLRTPDWIYSLYLRIL